MIIRNSGLEIDINTYNRNYAICDSNSGHLIYKSNNKILLNNDQDYYHYVRRIDHYSNIYYNITKRCNLKCSYCYSDNNNSYVSMDENKRILDKLQQLSTNTITLIGGEPFCHPYFSDILKDILNRDFSEICIVTNGTNINNINIDLLKDPRISLQISLDGYNEETNAPTRGKGVFSLVMETISHLQNQNISFRVMKVLTRGNINNSFTFFNYFYTKGIVPGFFMVKQVRDDDKPNIHQLEEFALKLFSILGTAAGVFNIIKFADNIMFETTGFPIAHCGAGITSLSINPNGDVYPCVKRSSPKDLIANLLETNAIDKTRINRKRIIDNELVFNKEDCIKCNIKYFCGGGCRAEEKNGHICRYNCEYFKYATNLYYKLLIREIGDGRHANK